MGLKFNLLLTQKFDAAVYPMGQFSRDYGILNSKSNHNSNSNIYNIYINTKIYIIS